MDNTHSEKPAGLLNLYFHFNGHKLLLFFGIVFLTILVVTGIYVSIFGFDIWKSNMSQAGSLMLANFPTAIANTGNPNAIPTVPNSPNAGIVTIPPSSTAVTNGTTSQFVCPNCGPVGLPNVDANGLPLCPSCGAVMGAGGPQTP
jgi:hypothetical protein